ncbi:hypothetical protein CBR_g45859 [Chara braunii]|uniref:Uncharacterized protein n=1 Tax=Chara braunii TaxID=69332 RepID=A0A388LZK5_CHABU|nr:hypothetical protein CBR_g45859 [Chara braunii]|eukprot:GBG87705.1 hypothetical protein CBR_g45859 [Chara braunii]
MLVSFPLLGRSQGGKQATGSLPSCLVHNTTRPCNERIQVCSPVRHCPLEVHFDRQKPHTRCEALRTTTIPGGEPTQVEGVTTTYQVQQNVQAGIRNRAKGTRKRGDSAEGGNNKKRGGSR